MTVLFFRLFTPTYVSIQHRQDWVPVTHDSPFRYRVNNFIIKNYSLNVKPGFYKDPGYYYAILI